MEKKCGYISYPTRQWICWVLHFLWKEKIFLHQIYFIINSKPYKTYNHDIYRLLNSPLRTICLYMRLVIQRVLQAAVNIENKAEVAINEGLLVFVGIEEADGQEDINWLCNKVVNLRIFNDANAIPNLSIKDIDGDILLVSQFTLHASTKKGNRPGYSKAARPEIAEPLYETMIKELELCFGKKIFTGEFGADMKVELLNDGPVTILMDTKNKE